MRMLSVETQQEKQAISSGLNTIFNIITIDTKKNGYRPVMAHTIASQIGDEAVKQNAFFSLKPCLY